MERTNPVQLGMKWYTFYVKIRPVIAIVSFIAYMFGYINTFLALVNFGLTGFLILYGAFAIGYVVYAILNIILFNKANKAKSCVFGYIPGDFLTFIRKFLIYETVFLICSNLINWYMENMNAIAFVISAVLITVFYFFVWYKCNVRYFHKRGEHMMNDSKNNQKNVVQEFSLSQEGESSFTPRSSFDILGSDIRLLNEDGREQATIPPAFSNQTIDKEVPAGKVKFCSECGNAIESVTKKCTGCGKQFFKGIPWKKCYFILVHFLLICAIVFGVYQYMATTDVLTQKITADEQVRQLENKIKSLETKLGSSENKNNYYKEVLSEYEAKIGFFDEYVVFVEDDGTMLYHKYDCSFFKGNNFWAYNVDNAKNQGYSPCSECSSLQAVFSENYLDLRDERLNPFRLD